MKTLFAIVLVGAAACGEDKAAPAAAQSFDAAAECTYSLPDSTTPTQLAQVLNDVKQGNLDPCGGALSSSVSRDGIARDSIARDGIARDGIARDGVARDGVARDGVARDGVARDSIVRQSAARAVLVRIDHDRENHEYRLVFHVYTLAPATQTP